MTDSDSDPIKTIEDGILWYVPGGASIDDEETYNDVKTKHEGKIEIYPGWVRFGGMTRAWIPRESVDEIHES
jgi:hypothetical protein